MKYENTKIPDCLIIRLKKFPDERGFFYEAYNSQRYLETFIHTRDQFPQGNPIGDILIQSQWRQTNCSVSRKGVVRGIHIVPFAKLVTCVHGHVWDVVVDMRKNSPTYKQWIGIDLIANSKEPAQVYVPPSCGHGFLALEEGSVVTYMQNGVYDPKVESSVHWRDKTLAITWPQLEQYIVSPKDEAAPHLVCPECGGGGYGIYGEPGPYPCAVCNP